MQEFDFDMWLRLAKSDQQEFARLKTSVVEKAILSGNNVRRMRGLQFRIDQEITLAHTPMKACLRLSSLMWDAFYELREQINMAFYPANRLGATPAKAITNAKILKLH